MPSPNAGPMTTSPMGTGPDGDELLEGAPTDEGAPESAQEGLDHEVEEAPSPLRHAGDVAMGAASGMGSSLHSGLGAMRDESDARRRYETALTQLAYLEEGIDEDRRTLAHREQVTKAFPDIVAAQREELRAASVSYKEAGRRAKIIQKDRDRLVAELERAKVEDEARLLPYKAALDEAQERFASANRTYEMTRDAYRAANDRLLQATAKRDQIAQATALAGSAAGATADMSQASAPEEVQRAVDIAQHDLWSARKSARDAVRAAREAKAEVDSRRGEHGKAADEARERERALEQDIHSREAALRELGKQRASARRRAESAKAIVEDARNVHDHPETTDGLRERIANEERDIEEKRSEIEGLAEEMDLARRRSRGLRLLIAIAVVVAIVVLIWVLWNMSQNSALQASATAYSSGQTTLG